VSRGSAARLTVILLAVALVAGTALTAATLTGCRPAPPPPPPIGAEPTPPGPSPDPDPAGPPDRGTPSNGALAALVVTSYPHDLGRGDLKDPDLRTLVELSSRAFAPPDQVWLLLGDGYDRAAAVAIAAAWGATLVGEIEMLSAYQLETTDTTLDQLLARLDEAAAHPHVAVALPNLLTVPDQRSSVISVESCDPTLNDNYRRDLARPHQMIGLRDAWAMVANSRLELSPVQAAILDTPVWAGTPEFNNAGGPQIRGLSVQALGANPPGDPPGNPDHGTQVLNTLAADHRVGGAIGVASIIGDRLTVNAATRFDITMDWIEQQDDLDPDDPTRLELIDGTYLFRDLLRLKALVEAAAADAGGRASTIINISLGPTPPTDVDGLLEALSINEAYGRFARWLAANHPGVLIVAAAGNDNEEVGPATEWWGQRLPNVITVGGLDPSGLRAPFSNFMGDDPELEVSLAAPASGIVTHLGQASRSVTGSGNSFAAPSVTGAAAILRSLKPDLTAGQIKGILVETAATSVRSIDDRSDVPIAANVGGRILRVDHAVLRVVNMVRQESGLPALTREQLLAASDFVVGVDGGPAEYRISVTPKVAEPSPITFTLVAFGPAALSPANATKTVGSGAAATWTLARAAGHEDHTLVATVAREDTRRCYRITIESPSYDDLMPAYLDIQMGLGVAIDGLPEVSYFADGRLFALPYRSNLPADQREGDERLRWQGWFFEAWVRAYSDAAKTGYDEHTVRGELAPDGWSIVWLEYERLNRLVGDEWAMVHIVMRFEDLPIYPMGTRDDPDITRGFSTPDDLRRGEVAQQHLTRFSYKRQGYRFGQRITGESDTGELLYLFIQANQKGF